VEVQDVPQAKTSKSKGRHASVSPQDLCEQWQIGLEPAKETLKRMTQQLAGLAVMPLLAHDANRVLQKKRLDQMWTSDAMNGGLKSLDGNRCRQAFLNGTFFAETCPIAWKADAGFSSEDICDGAWRT
jgi:hypothetical protein